MNSTSKKIDPLKQWFLPFAEEESEKCGLTIDAPQWLVEILEIMPKSFFKKKLPEQFEALGERLLLWLELELFFLDRKMLIYPELLPYFGSDQDAESKIDQFLILQLAEIRRSRHIPSSTNDIRLRIINKLDPREADKRSMKEQCHPELFENRAQHASITQDGLPKLLHILLNPYIDRVEETRLELPHQSKRRLDKRTFLKQFRDRIKCTESQYGATQ